MIALMFGYLLGGAMTVPGGGNPTGSDHSRIAHHAVLMATVWPLAIVAVFLPLSVRRYRRLS